MPAMVKRATMSRGSVRAETVVLAFVIGAILWFYFWTVRPEPSSRMIAAHGDHYFNLLTRGFLKGQLPLDVPVDPVLATLKNPWNAVERGNHGLHDATYYRGAYHLYFGATPVVALFLPFRLLTGFYGGRSSGLVAFCRDRIGRDDGARAGDPCPGVFRALRVGFWWRVWWLWAFAR